MPQSGESEGSRKVELSSQAKWYLCGNWPIINGVYGHKDVHIDEMRELISKGLVTQSEGWFTKRNCFRLTVLGYQIREDYKRC